MLIVKQSACSELHYRTHYTYTQSTGNVWVEQIKLISN